MERLRVVQVVTTLGRGGAQATVLASSDMVDYGIDVTVLAGPDDPGEGTHWAELADGGPPVVEVPPLRRSVGPLADPRALAWLRRWLRANRPHVVHTHSSKAGAVGRLAAAAVGIPVAHTIHGWSFAPQRPAGLEWRAGAPAGAGSSGALTGSRRAASGAAKTSMERALARRTDALVVVTPFDRLQGLAMGIGRPDQYRLIRSGIDLETPRLGRFRRHEIRAELGIDGRFAIGTVGRLAEQKDLGTLIDGFARAELETAVLVLIGEGPERRALEVRAREAGVDGRVLFSGGRHDAAELVAGLDVFALTSRWEGLPRSLVEAIAAGVPVVATPVGGVTELVRPEETGTLVAPCDPAALATALRDQLERPFHFRRLAACASAEIGPFSVDSMREELASLWFDLAQR